MQPTLSTVLESTHRLPFMISDVFCKIIKGELPAKVVAESERWLAFDDIAPKAPVHVIIIPKEHLLNIDGADGSHKELLGELLLAASEVAKKKGISEKGYRIIINQGGHGGQLVPHLHLHVLGGRNLGAKIVAEK